MKIIKPYYTILDPLDGDAILGKIERCGRVCYKSEDKITADSARAFVANIIKRGHESVLEHFSFSVLFVCDRGVSHELVRHRISSVSQESTRYCNYGNSDDGCTFVFPLFFAPEDQINKEVVWCAAMRYAEDAYAHLIRSGASPQEARSVLPNSLKTEVVMTANLREWRHILRLRTASAAHPQMRELTVPLLEELKTLVPVVFDDIEGAPV